MASTPISRRPILHRALFLVVLTFFVFCPLPVFSQVDTTITPESEAALDEELRWLKAETFVFTASKVMENIKKAPASITVIKDRQIRQMGAKHLHDVIMRAVPSFFSEYGYNGTHWPRVRGRGFRVLLMINSHPIYDVFSQGINQWAYDTLPMDNIKRIEFMRGPGSALYGSGAYDGVINVITKEAEDIDGVELTARGGSWDTQQYNLLYGKTLKDLEVAFNVNYFKTHGHRAFIREDQLTALDRILALPPASLAPGRTRGNEEKYDVALTLT